MRRWFKLTFLRIVLLAIPGLLFIGLFSWLPAKQANNTIHKQTNFYTQAAKSLETARDSLASEPDAGQIGLRQPDQFKSYADETNSIANHSKTLSLPTAQPAKSIIAIRLGRNGQIIADVNLAIKQTQAKAAYQNTTKAITSLRDLTAYQARVMKALANLLEYDPATDTANFSLGSSDTSQRLSLAQTGLDSVQANLQSSKNSYPDQRLGQVVLIVSNLQNQLKKLAQLGDTQSWQTEVEAAQAQIVSNRVGFWNQNSAQISGQLKTAQANLVQTQKLWQNLASQYRL